MGARVGLRCVPRPHRSWRPEAQGHHLLPRRPPRARCRRPPVAPHHRRGRLQRGVPRRCARPRRAPGGRRRGRLAGGQRHAFGRAADGVGLRVGRGGSHRWRGGRPHRARGQGAGRLGRSRHPAAGGAGVERGADPWVDEQARPRRTQGRSPAGPRVVGGQGPPGRAQPAHPGPRHRPARRWRDGVGGRRDLRRVAAVRDQGHAPQPRQHDRGGHHRGEQERDRRASPRPAREPDPYDGAPWKDTPR